MEIETEMFPPVSEQLQYARGGKVPIAAAGGEWVLTPEQVAVVGGGNLDQGHNVLDAWVISERRKLIETLSSLPGPAR